MRALLIVNPGAGGTAPRVREVLAGALGSILKLDVATSARRGHAIDLAHQAAVDGLDAVVALGGDGTVNEVVNGLLSDGPAAVRPALAVVPVGSTNIFARVLGLPRDPVEATGEILTAIRAGRSRLVGLGRLDERWFTCCAGIGFDAEIVRRVERRRRHGDRASGPAYVRSASAQFVTAMRRQDRPLTLYRPGADPVTGLFAAFVANAAPWSFLGSRSVNLCPQASFDTGLDLVALSRMGLFSMLRSVRQMLTTDAGPRGRGVLAWHDESDLAVAGDRPLAVQVDGEYLGERESIRLRAVPRALRVIC